MGSHFINLKNKTQSEAVLKFKSDSSAHVFYSCTRKDKMHSPLSFLQSTQQLLTCAGCQTRDTFQPSQNSPSSWRRWNMCMKLTRQPGNTSFIPHWGMSCCTKWILQMESQSFSCGLAFEISLYPTIVRGRNARGYGVTSSIEVVL